jgi:hypothetical protein
MKVLIKGAIVLLLAAAFLGIHHLSSAAEGGIRVWPTWVEFTINSGEQTTQTVNVQNLDNEFVRIRVYAMDFSIDREGNFAFYDPGHESYSASKWLAIEEGELELAPDEVKEIKVGIVTPAEVEPGGHYAALFFEPIPLFNQGAISISTRIPSLFYLTVPGVTEADISVNADIVSLMMPGFAEKGPVEMGVMVRNSGNVHLTVAAKAYFSASWGGGSELDLGQMVILPNSEGVMKGNWQQAPFFGRVKASIVIGYLNQNGELVNKTQTSEFWVIPWKVFTFGTVGLCLFISGSVIIGKRYRFKLERKK